MTARAPLPPLWTCPKCGAKFVSANMSHSCGRFALGALFARSEPHVFKLFQKLRTMVRACGRSTMIPQKTRVVFMVRMRFAGATVRKSHLRVGLILERRLPPDARLVQIESFGPRCHGHYFMVEGQVLAPNQTVPLGPLLFVNETYFSTLGAPLLRGRFFTERDDDKAPDAAIINETLAKQYFPGVDPVGRRLKIGGPERPNNTWNTIVGVVADINYSGLDAPPEPVVYYPFRQNTTNNQYVVIRTAMNPQSLERAVRVVVADLDKDLPIVNLRTMDQLMTEAVAPPRFRTILVSMFAVVGLLLAAIGIYGVMAYAVTERTHELGVRIALGADRGDVLRIVLGEAAWLAACGVGLGVAGALGATRLIQTLLFGVTPTDALTFVAIAMLLTATAFVASYIPARRATRVDPMVALRYE